MISINIGSIEEMKNKNKKRYVVSLLESTRSVSFNDLKKAMQFIGTHVNGIFEIQSNVPSLHLCYHHFGGDQHYILFQKNESGEVIVFEETKFDFLRTHPHKRTKYRLRRAVNDQNYSFSDVFRITINWHPFFSIWNTIILLFILVGSGLFLIYGLNYFGLNKENYSVFYKVLLLTSFFIGLVAVFLISIFHFQTRFKLFQVSGDFKEINWRKWYLIRINQLILSILFASISLTTIILLLERAFYSYPEFKIVLIINLVFWLLNLISSITMLAYSYRKRVAMLKKYFTKKEIRLFKKWLSNPEKKEVSKSNKLFLFDEKFSNYLTREAIDKAILDLRWLTLPDLKKMRDQELQIKHKIIQTYKKRTTGDSNDNIYENNQ